MSICLGELCGLQAVEDGRITGTGYDAMLVSCAGSNRRAAAPRFRWPSPWASPFTVIERKGEENFELFRLEEA